MDQETVRGPKRDELRLDEIAAWEVRRRGFSDEYRCRTPPIVTIGGTL